ncbi:ABC transporter permease [[Mycoplasma] anseris]|uniref:ABC transporter permease n=1 Tax=[Mycoplasma] anseris TaxID=92400 RepID=A0A2Z4NCJ2_9BACT|nr:ABC transporter permease [[Mycoplasma] anseris]AWX69205.1 ABC transporter permease [[Mycoplasma] anseris]
MTQMWRLFKRNCLCFIKEPKRIFITALSPLIVFLCFILFAKNIYKEQLGFAFKTQEVYDGLYLFSEDAKKMLQNEYADWFLLIGLITVTTFTNALAISSVMVSDAEKKVLNDLFITPVRSSVIRFSYLFFNIVVNMVITSFIYLVTLGWMGIDHTLTFSVNVGFRIWGIAMLGCLFNSAMIVFFISYVKNIGVYSALNSVLSMVAGFLTGAFVPLNTLPRAVAETTSLFPTTQIGNLIRGSLLDGKHVFLNSAANSRAFFFWMKPESIELWHMALFVGIMTIFFLVLNFTVSYNRKRK